MTDGLATLNANPLKDWIARSREEERRAPERYLSHYVDKVTCDEKYAHMMRNTLDEIKMNCGEYNGTMPTGAYCGKIFLRQGFLVWFGIDKTNPMVNTKLNFREIRIIDE
jgi:hypothetical protein